MQNTMILSEAEKGEGLPSCLFWRCVAVDSRVDYTLAAGAEAAHAIAGYEACKHGSFHVNSSRPAVQNVVRIAPGLPPKPQETRSNSIAQYPGWMPQDIAIGVFAFESFIEVPIPPGCLSCRCSAYQSS